MSQLNKNIFIIACAGSGKTVRLVKEALKTNKSNILFTTFTNENIEQINDYFLAKCGYIPSNVSIQTWFRFLLQNGVRPYQNILVDKPRVRSIFFQIAPKPFHKAELYFTNSNDIYSHKLSEFMFQCNKSSNGLVIKRLEKMYEYIMIDELQDLSGYDLEVLNLLIASNIKLICVGDPRQGTFSTNYSPKNKQYRKAGIFDWLKNKSERGLVKIEEMNVCRRSNPSICKFADKLYPHYSPTTSIMEHVTDHDGVFAITPDKVEKYVQSYNPQILKYNKTTQTYGYVGRNIGASKGKTFDRTLIFPSGTMIKYLISGDLSKFKDIAKLYVACTRARYSTTFVVNDNHEVEKFNQIWDESLKSKKNVEIPLF
jgi:DNA helicase-2/ATP-dependent DNA helicase PcrA